jgi:acyl carrier protein
MSDDVRSQVRGFISARFPQVSLPDDQDLFAMGFITSLFAMELVMFVEQQFALRIPNDELKRDNFRTVDAVVDLVGRITPPVGAGA